MYIHVHYHHTILNWTNLSINSNRDLGNSRYRTHAEERGKEAGEINERNDLRVKMMIGLFCCFFF